MKDLAIAKELYERALDYMNFTIEPASEAQIKDINEKIAEVDALLEEEEKEQQAQAEADALAITRTRTSPTTRQ